MKPPSRREIRTAEHVERALAEAAPVVALESTVIAHGLPYPTNLETALACEQVIRQNGATPATIGIVEGAPTIGLTTDQIEEFAKAQAAGGRSVEKVGLNNLAGVINNCGWGATTVASSLKLAHAAGVHVFSTGGIGGVHRGASESFDISADLTALGDTPVICVCAGAKAILDLPKTLEYLETLGVPVIGYGTNEFPAFYSRSSGLKLELSISNPDQAAELASSHWHIGGATAVLICAPVPVEFEIPVEEIDALTEKAIAGATRAGVRGKALTPYLLSELKDLTSGKTLDANRELLINNAELAARIASSAAMRPCALTCARCPI
ncbi:MAG TPA: pseudouridine-5'-phosphate glycosidase [Blastocatellia bacterium]|nr:pseudouridine-5'-phosphate glycosidase [Blastocatellia bacterium]